VLLVVLPWTASVACGASADAALAVRCGAAEEQGPALVVEEGGRMAAMMRMMCPYCDTTVETLDPSASAGHKCKGKGAWLPLVWVRASKMAVPKRKGK
jgi:hypothetical protein